MLIRLADLIVRRRMRYTHTAGTLKQSSISRISSEVSGFKHIMAEMTQPRGQPAAGTSIDQEFHEFAIDIASSESRAMTACA